MPNIVIKEYDKTSAGIGLYANFAVLVPGYYKPREYVAAKQAYMYGGKTVFSAANDSVPDEGEPIWTEDGVYEFTKQEDFVAMVGKVPAKDGIVKAAKAPIVDDTRTLEDQEEFDELVAGGKLYTRTDNEDPTNIGYLKDASYDYHIVTLEDEFDDTYQYSIIKPVNVGNDEEKADHYGNQIAYELLGLGYTVLYKKLDADEEMSVMTDDSWWAGLKDKSVYDFRYIVTGLLDNNHDVNEAIRNLAHFVNTNPKNSGRGDCTALLDIPMSSYVGLKQVDAIAGVAAEANKVTASKYAALFAPFVTYNMKYDAAYENSTFPASFHYLACAAKAAEYYNEWYAIAGYTRGISDYSIAGVGCKFGETAVEALEPRHATDDVTRSVNLIVKIKNNYYLWGNRTAHLLGAEGTEDGDLKASHFLNIRQLCSTIKKQVYITCRRYTFDPNSDLLWINFCNGIRPLLEKMKADQGITDYKFIKVKAAQKAVLKAKIRIVPIEAVEDFDISLTLEDSISGVVAGIDEEE